jgi:HEPN domain-containing protein
MNTFSTILMILGALFLLLIIALFIGYLWLRGKIRGIGKELKNLELGAANLSPMRIHLEETSSPDFKDKEKVAKFSESFLQNDFKEIGKYRIPEIAGLYMVSFINKDKNYYGVVYEHPAAGVISDVVIKYEDGGSLTTSNATLAGNLDKMPDKKSLYIANGDVESLIKLMEENIEDKLIKKVTAETFVENFEKAYADEMDWRASRGGPTEEEIRRVAESSGKNYNDDVISLTHSTLSNTALKQLSEACMYAYFNENNISQEQQENYKKRILVVHDKLYPDDVIDEIFDNIDIPENETHKILSDYSDIEDQFQSTREVIKWVNEKFPPGHKLDKLGETKEPAESDIYLFPKNS